ncbi:hypothetical protein DFJ73DRAFT_819675 [Zopfochytrium polystomum]|nr:hypothetical protein DFJ73DRAFT_819675 [Zopfochytrium polystomum]
MSATAATAAAAAAPVTVIELDARDTNVAAVTVFPEGSAVVTRSFPLQLAPGTTRVEVSNLPSCMDRDRLRVRGKGVRPVVISDVIYHPPESIGGFELGPSEKSQELKELEAEHAQLLSKKSVLKSQIKAVLDFGSSIKADKSKIDDILQFVDLLDGRGNAMADRLLKLDEEIAQVDQKINEYNRKNSRRVSNRSQCTVRVSAVLHAQEATTVKLDMVYCCVSPSIRLSPTYDMRVSTVDGKPTRAVDISFKAVISQTTGEDWNNCALALSTVTTTKTTGVPRHARVNVQAKGTFAQKQAVQSTTVVVQQHQGLFGSSNSNVNQAPRAGFGFGGGGAFGGAAQNAQPAAQPSTNAFGSSSGAFGSTGGGFGSTGGVFGAAAAPPAAAPSFSFGAPAVSAAAPATEATPLFGSGPTAGGESRDAGAVPAADEFDFVEDEAGAQEPAPVELVEFETPATVLTDKAVGGVFKIEGASTIASDDSTHKVTIASFKCESLVRWFAVPHVSPGVVFMECQVRNTSGYQLFAGPVSIFLDDDFVNSSEIKHVNLNDYFSCSLGVDPSLRIHHRDTVKTLPAPASAYAARVETKQYETQFTVKNRGRSAVPRLHVKESLPVLDAEATGMRVVLRQPKLVAASGEAVRGEVAVADGGSGAKSGNMEYVCDVPAGGEVSFALEFEVVGPVGSNFALARQATK